MSNNAKWNTVRTLASSRPNVSPYGFSCEVYKLCQNGKQYAIVSVDWGNYGEGIHIYPIDIEKNHPQDDINWCRKYEAEFRDSVIKELIGDVEYEEWMCRAGNFDALNRARDGVRAERKCVRCGIVTKDWYYYDNCNICASCLNKGR